MTQDIENTAIMVYGFGRNVISVYGYRMAELGHFCNDFFLFRGSENTTELQTGRNGPVGMAFAIRPGKFEPARTFTASNLRLKDG